LSRLFSLAKRKKALKRSEELILFRRHPDSYGGLQETAGLQRKGAVSLGTEFSGGAEGEYVHHPPFADDTAGTPGPGKAFTEDPEFSGAEGDVENSRKTPEGFSPPGKEIAFPHFQSCHGKRHAGIENAEVSHAGAFDISPGKGDSPGSETLPEQNAPQAPRGLPGKEENEASQGEAKERKGGDAQFHSPLHVHRDPPERTATRRA